MFEEGNAMGSRRRCIYKHDEQQGSDVGPASQQDISGYSSFCFVIVTIANVLHDTCLTLNTTQASGVRSTWHVPRAH